MKVNAYCEYMKNPVGLDMKHPRFSWGYEGNDITGKQEAYQIRVWDSAEMTAAHCAWNTGRVESKESMHVKYEGIPLETGQTYYYQVTVWAGMLILESERQKFTMGLMNPDHWEAEWIGGSALVYCCRYRRQFSVGKPVESATLFLASPCYCLLTVNGKRADGSVLNNVITDSEKTMPYAVYEISDLLKAGENVIGIECGARWEQRDNMFSAQILLRYKDGTKEQINSDTENWYYTGAVPVRYCDVYHGEIYDARMEEDGWDTADFQMGEHWTKVVEHEPCGGKLKAQNLEPIKIVREIPAREIYEVGDGSYTVDMGQNFAGWVRIRVKGERGTEIVLKYAELMHADHTINPLSNRTAQATDHYILKGEKEEIYEPRFTYHGFRYVQIYGLNEKPEKDMITGCVVRSAVDRIGNFTCSNELLNRIYKAVVWTEESNMHGIPTDCPQRDERFGWLNDMTARNELAAYLFRLPKFYAKWLNDIRDTQGRVTGAIGDTAPYKFGFRPADPVCSSFLLVPWNMYLHYGDREILEENYDAMKKWVAFLLRNTEGSVMKYSQMGDWAGPIGGAGKEQIGGGALSSITPTILVGTGHLYYDCILLKKIAKVLGKKEDANYYEDTGRKVKEAINRKFYRKEEKYYAQNSQAGNGLALYLHINPEEDKKAILNHLVEDIRDKNAGHLTTGNLCTKYCEEVLFENGEKDLAYRVLSSKEYPSLGYMVENGATTIWERWEKVEEEGMQAEMASHNHPMNGAIGVCMEKYLAGIQVDEQAPGFENIIFKPYIPEGLDEVTGSLESVRGTITSAWKKTENGIEMNLRVPFNSTGTVYLEKTENTEIWKNGEVLEQESYGMKDNVCKISIPSGETRIQIIRK